MPEFTIGSVTFGDTFWQGVYSAGIILLFTALNGIAYLLLHKVARRLTRRWRNQLGERLISAITGPIHLIILVQGLFLATTPIDALEPWRDQLRTLWAVTVIALVASSIARLVNEFLAWYSRYIAPRRKGDFTSRLVPAFRRVLSITIYLISGMLILDQLNISITPLVAGFGIGGIAVALALQPTLSNFFAGTYLVSGDVLSPGDYIELENGLRGYVVEVGWRSTRLRTAFNNLVIIPNSRLADSILTNYYGPTMEIGVIVECGVSYDSDLEQVERVAMEVASGVIEELPEAKKPYDPWFGYEQFGDSNIDFWVWLEATDRLGAVKLKSELIKRLHKRFAEEGIEINYPVRKLVYPTTNGVPPMVELQELRSTGARSRRKSKQPSQG